ncbi:MAG: MurR/RpiR family transcriptional regulator, partial [Bacilli bacterium]
VYLLDEPEVFATRSAEQIGKEIGVSESTVIRFCQALEYRGFSQLQKDIQAYLFNSKSSLQAYQKENQEIENEPKFFERVMLRDQNNIIRTIAHLNEEDFQLAVKKLSDSDNIIVSGMRTSYAMAHWFTFTMDVLRGNTRMFRPYSDDLILYLTSVNENSVFVAFSFHRYALETIRLVKEFKNRGAFIIGFTDSVISPIGEYADIVFSANLEVKSTFDAAPVTFSFLNALTAGVSLQNKDRLDERQKKYESYHLKDFFL